MPLTSDQMFLMLIKRISVYVDWLIIGFAHLTLLVWAVWWWQVTPADVSETLLRFAQSRSGALLGLFGVSGLAILGIWLRLCFRLTRKLTSHYVWKPVHEQAARD